MMNSAGHPPATITSSKKMIGVGSQLSVAVALPVLAVIVLAAQSIVIFGGQLSTGAALSSTTITCRQVLLLPQSSVARQVLLMVYSWGQMPPTVTSVDVMAGVP